jgi:hypothetical protein
MATGFRQAFVPLHGPQIRSPNPSLLKGVRHLMQHRTCGTSPTAAPMRSGSGMALRALTSPLP